MSPRPSFRRKPESRVFKLLDTGPGSWSGVTLLRLYDGIVKHF
jgi:hypothetical protein